MKNQGIYLAKYMTKEAGQDIVWIRDKYFQLMPYQKVYKAVTPILEIEQKVVTVVKPEVQAVQSRLDEPA